MLKITHLFWSKDYSYTSFSGWLVASGQTDNSFSDRNSYESGTCCCSRVCPVRPNEPPFLRPSYNAPTPQAPGKGYGAPKPRPPASGYGVPKGRPIYNPIPSRKPKITPYNPRPSYNSKPSYKPVPAYKPDLVPPPPPLPSPPAPPVGPSVIVGREPSKLPRTDRCCDSLLVSASSKGRALTLQVIYLTIIYNFITKGIALKL